MIDFTGQPWLPPVRDASGPVALADLPPVDDRYLDELQLEPGSLLRVAEQLAAQTFALVGDEVTFTARGPVGVRRWRGRLGRPGVVPV